MSGQTTMRATFREGSIHQPTSLLPSATNKASATGETPCVHQSTAGWEVGCEWRFAPIGGRRADVCPYKLEIAAVFSRSGEKRNLSQKCSELEGCRHQTEDGMKVRVSRHLHQPGGSTKMNKFNQFCLDF